MKLRKIFRFLAAALFLIALFILLCLQNPRTDQLAVALYIGFASLLTFSAACLFTGELFARIERLEKKIGDLENEMRRLNYKNE